MKFLFSLFLPDYSVSVFTIVFMLLLAYCLMVICEPICALPRTDICCELCISFAKLCIGAVSRLRRISSKLRQLEISFWQDSIRSTCSFSPPIFARLLLRMAWRTCWLRLLISIGSDFFFLLLLPSSSSILHLRTRCLSSTRRVGLTRTLGIFSTSTLFLSCVIMRDLSCWTSFFLYDCRFFISC